MKTLGILGGVGPQTTSKVYHSIINFFRERCFLNYPSIVIYNLPFPFSIENDAIIEGTHSEKMLPYLIDGAKILEKSGATFGILPCNTLHKYIENIRNSVNIPFLSIVEETSTELKSKGYKKVGILATATTINDKLYDCVLNTEGIDILLPTSEEQMSVNKIIVELINNKVDLNQGADIEKVCRSLSEKGAECILLACTDLQILISEIAVNIPVIDTTEILIKASQKELIS